MNKIKKRRLSDFTREELINHYEGWDLIPLTHFAVMRMISYRTALKRYEDAIIIKGVKCVSVSKLRVSLAESVTV